MQPPTCRNLALIFAGFAAACGGAQASTELPDESADYGGAAGSSHSREGTAPVSLADVDGTRWSWVEAHCTEGPLDLAAEGFSQQLNITRQESTLLLTYDHVFEARQCVQTVVQRATPTDDPTSWQMVEEVRIAVPANDACYGRMEEPRPGEVRRAGEFLEVLVQRSQWCNGLEARMVYAPQSEGQLAPEQVVRHYIAHWNRRDALAIADLFAESGSLVEPFTVSSTGGTTRHDGRQAVTRWHLSSFAGLPWVTVKLEELTPGPQPGQVVARWTYMDPRLSEPFQGRHQFTVAAGEIFEADIVAQGAPELQTGAEGDEQQSAAQP